MKTTRAIAATAVHQVVHSGRNLNDALGHAGADELEQRDRSFVRALVFGTLRTHLRNRYIIGKLVERPFRRRDLIVEALLSTGLFALLDSQQPDYAAVSATVDATRELGRPGMRGLVNALLRRFLRERDDLLAAVQHEPEACWQHPQWLIERVQQDWPDDWRSILEAGNQQAPMWLRINRMRTTRADWLARANTINEFATAPLQALPAAVVLADATAVDELPGFAAGECSVQDAASQIPAMLLAPQPGMSVLDACAAPGGKTGHLLEWADNAARITALDNSEQRLERVRENLQRLHLSANVVCGDALLPDNWWDGEFYDRILVDAPCSAVGVIRRHPDIRFLRRADDVNQLQQTQRALLKQLWRLLKPGGRLLYSTCSVLHAENEDVVAGFLAGENTAVGLDLRGLLPEGLTEPADHGAYLLPGRHTTDGFYYALMERTAG